MSTLNVMGVDDDSGEMRVWKSANTLNVSTLQNPDEGGSVSLTAGSAQDGVSDAGTINLNAGSSGQFSGATLRVKGSSPGDTVGGGVTMSGGTVATAVGDGGAVTISSGAGGETSGAGGAISLTAGSAQGGNSDGGSIIQRAGTPAGAGTEGSVQMQDSHGGSRFISQFGLGAAIQNGGDFNAIHDTSLLSADRNFKYPDQAGTFALISDTTPVSHARATAQTAANTNVLTVTVPAADTTYQLLTNVLVTTSTAFSFGVTVDYTDEGNTSRTLTIPVAQLAGTLITAITNVTGAGPYEGVSLTIRCKASTSIVFKTAGTFTTCQYNVDASAIKIA